MGNGYLARSWTALKSNPGWWKTVLVLTLAALIPVFGPLVVSGYLFQWGRDSAWGVERPLPTHMGRFKVYCKSGAIAFVTLLVWGVLVMALYAAIAAIPVFGIAFAVLLFPILAIATLVMNIMALRAVIYDSLIPGFEVPIAWDMANRDPDGLARVFAIALLAAASSIVSGALVAVISLLRSAAFFTAEDGFLSVLIAGLHPLGIVLAIVIGFAGLFGVVLADALAIRSLGYWMAEFEPATWGASATGIPAGVGPQRKWPVGRRASSGPAPSPDAAAAPSATPAPGSSDAPAAATDAPDASDVPSPDVPATDAPDACGVPSPDVPATDAPDASGTPEA